MHRRLLGEHGELHLHNKQHLSGSLCLPWLQIPTPCKGFLK